MEQVTMKRKYYAYAVRLCRPLYFPGVVLAENKPVNPVHTIMYKSVSGTHGPQVKNKKKYCGTHGPCVKNKKKNVVKQDKFK